MGGKEVKVRREGPVLQAHPRFRATVFLPSFASPYRSFSSSLPPSLPFPQPLSSKQRRRRRRFLFPVCVHTYSLRGDLPIVCRFARNEHAPVCAYGRTYRRMEITGCYVRGRKVIFPRAHWSFNLWNCAFFFRNIIQIGFQRLLARGVIWRSAFLPRSRNMYVHHNADHKNV